ncbi:MAG: DUF5060 domain-containing protein, partial [Chloroflexota bacterium]
MKKTLHVIAFLAILCILSCKKNEPLKITGEMKAWHTITLTLPGPETTEYDTVNPFTDYRLDVEFSQGDRSFTIPGYFAADGNAAETSARSGDRWRVHFCPPSTGDWNYKVTFLKGRNIAVADVPASGEACFMNGETGTFTVMNADNSAEVRTKGRLQYTGGRYLRYAATGELFLKNGADSPENLLGYKDFDGTYYGGNNVTRSGEAAINSSLHRYEPHVKDWKEGDPSWKNGKGKGLIGGLNYLASEGVNSIYFLTMNILGDGEDVWPYTDRNERYRFDCSKLDQWEIVFSHAENLGINLHYVLEETENQCLLDAGRLDVQRKLYLRELIARFSHHLAITWNVGEEHHAADFSPYGMTYADTKKMADYIRKTDPYDNYIVIHTHSNNELRRKNMTEYLSFNNVDGPSIQCGDVDDVHEETRYWVNKSGGAGHQWVVNLDEIGPSWKGAMPDSFDPAHDTIRHKVLWGNLMAGGAGVEWYFGYKYPHSDLGCEDWRSRDMLWDQTRLAVDFFRNNLPLEDMNSADELTEEGNYCLAKANELYVVYLPEGKQSTLKVPAGSYDIQWFNPRTG